MGAGSRRGSASLLSQGELKRKERERKHGTAKAHNSPSSRDRFVTHIVCRLSERDGETDHVRMRA